MRAPGLRENEAVWNRRTAGYEGEGGREGKGGKTLGRNLRVVCWGMGREERVGEGRVYSESGPGRRPAVGHVRGVQEDAGRWSSSPGGSGHALEQCTGGTPRLLLPPLHTDSPPPLAYPPHLEKANFCQEPDIREGLVEELGSTLVMYRYVR